MKFLFLLLFFPFNAAAQNVPVSVKQLTGLWKGYITTAEVKVPYELVFSELNGKLVGWSYTTFTVKDAAIVTMKKVSVSFKEGIIVEDDENVYNNFPSEQFKKIKQTNILSLEENATSSSLTGTFETRTPNSLKRAKGTVSLEKKNTPDSSSLIAKLGEMDIARTLSFSFNTPTAKQPDTSSLAVVENNIPEKAVVTPIPLPIVKADTTDPGNDVLISKPDPLSVAAIPYDAPKRTDPVFKNKQAPVVVLAPVKPVVKTDPPVPAVQRPEAVVAKTPPAVPVAKAKIPVPVIKTLPPPPPVAKAKIPVPVVKKTSPPPVTVVTVKAAPKPIPINVAVAAPIDFGKRKIEIIDRLSIFSDSLQFTLYDNGFVDGDTVSIILNGKTIVSRQGLSTNAFTKTIYLTPDMGDSVQIIMYAENLGSIAPNTGLMILNYDKQRREVRFSGDLSKNAAITLRRKPKE